MLKNVSDVTSEGKGKGLNTQGNILVLDKSQSPDMMNVIVRFDGSLEKRLGTNTQNSVIIAGSAGAGFSPTGGITSNLIAFWKMDESSGNRKDSFGGHTLIDNNLVPSDGGIRNKAAFFRASCSNYLLHANTSTLATGDVNFAISAWIYLNSTSGTVQRAIVSKKDASVGAQTVLLLHCDGTDASTTFTDSSSPAKTVTAVGDAQLDTAQFKFGTASGLFDGTGDELTVTDHADFDFGTGDFTIEFFVRFNSVTGVQGFCYEDAAETSWIEFYLNDADLECRIEGSTTFEFPQWESDWSDGHEHKRRHAWWKS